MPLKRHIHKEKLSESIETYIKIILEWSKKRGNYNFGWRRKLYKESYNHAVGIPFFDPWCYSKSSMLAFI